MQLYTVQEVFEILKENKIPSHLESVRRWLREGVIKGIPPVTRKEGWKVTKDALDRFLEERLPNYNPTKDAKEPKETIVVLNEEQKYGWNWNSRKKIFGKGM